MRHKVKKIKFRKGKNASEATMRKLAVNFIDKGKIKTTLAKAKSLKSLIDRLVSKAKEKKESTKNILLKHLGEKKTMNKLFDTIAPKFNDRSSGFVRVIKLGERLGDGAEMGKVEWVRPFVEVGSSKLEVRDKRKEKQKENDKLSKINKTSKGKRS